MRNGRIAVVSAAAFGSVAKRPETPIAAELTRKLRRSGDEDISDVTYSRCGKCDPARSR